MRSPTGLAAVLIALVAPHAACASVQASSESAIPGTVTIHLRPEASSDGAVRAIDVNVTVAEAVVPAGGRIAVLPVMTSALKTSADDITLFTVSDSAGIVPAQTQDVTRNPDNVDRYWIAGRATRGALTWRYRVNVDPAKPLLSLPMFEMRSDHDVLSGAAIAFLVLPADTAKRRANVHWDLKALAPGAVGISSFGTGDSTSTDQVTAKDLSYTYYMVGSPGRYAAPKSGFFSGWQGTPAFDMAALMGWSSALHGFYGRFFNDPKPVFGIFARSNPSNPGSGVGLTNSFAFTFGNTTTASELKSILAHEMLHVWVSSLDSHGDADPLLGAWFSEGLAVYYQRNLPFRAGAISPEEYLADLNRTAVRYYTDSMIETPNDGIADAFWRDTRVRVLPYDRGSLYFAGLNARIVKASGGRRSLDDLVLALLAERRAGRPMTVDTWQAFLRRETGNAGVDDWHAMLAGRRIDVASDAFGPCFVKTVIRLGEFDMGYDFVKSRSNGRIVTGVKPGSNAARAGLRDGDVVKKGDPGDTTQGERDAMVTLLVERAGHPFTIRYNARGRILPVPQWVLRTDGDDCGREGRSDRDVE